MDGNHETEFGEFRVALANGLELRHVEQLAAIFTLCPAENGRLRNSENPGLLLSEILDQRGIIHKTDVSRILAALRRITLDSLATQLEEYKIGSNPDPAELVAETEKWHDAASEFPEQRRCGGRESSHPPPGRRDDGVLPGEEVRVVGTEQEYYGTGVERDAGREEFLSLLEYLGLRSEPPLLSVRDLSRIREYDLNPLNEPTCKNAVHLFLSRLMSHDHRARDVFSRIHPETNIIEEHEYVSLEEALRGSNQSSDRGNPSDGSLAKFINRRDCVFATLLSCDPFLMQILLAKMALCQLAIPLVFTNPSTNEMAMALWGLQKVTKTWSDSSNRVHEVFVANHKFPTVAVMRLGEVAVSKSNILNLMLGSHQDRSEHSYFSIGTIDGCKERKPMWSQGSIEAFWFQPYSNAKQPWSFSQAICFLNLRGSAVTYQTQLKFLCSIATCALVFVDQKTMLSHKSSINLLCEKGVSVNLVNTLTASREAPSIRKIKNPDGTVMNLITFGLLNTGNEAIAKHLCETISPTIEYTKRSNIEIDGFRSAHELHIFVDTEDRLCEESRDIVGKILHPLRIATQDYNDEGSMNEYKSKTLHLQGYWEKWTEIDKDMSWQDCDHDYTQRLDKRELDKQEQREKQLNIGPSKPIEVLCESLSVENDDKIQFVLSWLDILLDGICRKTLGMVFEKALTVECQLQETEKNIRDYIIHGSEEINQETENRQNLLSKKQSLSRQIDILALGVEHFIREIGQVYESGYKFPDNMRINMPAIGAKLLLLGTPLEIFDGDTFHAPLKWVTAVLESLQDEVGDRRVFVISVVGIQSSGKSTFLNSMFGTRFPVSAGRCTRGVFMQLREIDDDIKDRMSYDYILILDTEGLQDPTKSRVTGKNPDSELVTFALCLSDLTLVNVAGQVIGEELTDLLQVAAHAFIRMTMVELHSTCRIIQQFVADITAHHKNATSFQTILSKLNDAVRIAAEAEGVGKKYGKFSDVFNVLNELTEDLQYIPVLWSGPASPPNCLYSERVRRLKTLLLKSHPDGSNCLRISQFRKKFIDVWNAVKHEDFVFNFKNSLVMAAYNDFQKFYQEQKTKFQKETNLELLNRISVVENALAKDRHGYRTTAISYLETQITNRETELHRTIKSEINKPYYVTIKFKYIGEFERDLRAFSHCLIQESQARLHDASNLAERKEDVERSQITKELQDMALAESDNLRARYKNAVPGVEIRNKFDGFWKTNLDKIEVEYPQREYSVIFEEIEKLTIRCLWKKEGTILFKFIESRLDENPLPYPFANNCDPKVEYDKEKLLQIRASLSDIETGQCLFRIQNASSVIGMLVSSIPQSYEGRAKDRRIISEIEEKMNIKSKTSRTHTDIQFRWAIFLAVVIDHVWQPLPTLTDEGPPSSTREEVTALVNDVVKSRSSLWGNIMGNVKSGKPHTFYSFDNEEERTIISEAKRLYSNMALDPLRNLKDTIKEMVDFTFKLIKNKGNTQYKKEFVHVLQQHLVEAIVKKQKGDNAYPETKQKRMHKGRYEEIKETVFSQLEQLQLGEADEMLDSDQLQTLKGSLNHETFLKLLYLPKDSTSLTAIDLNLIQKLPFNCVHEYEQIISLVKEVKSTFIKEIMELECVSELDISGLIDKTQEVLSGKVDSDVIGLVIRHICAWAIPISASIQKLDEVKRNIFHQLRGQEKKHFEYFESRCRGVQNNRRIAEDLIGVLEPASIGTAKNQFCTSLFEILQKRNEFKTRQGVITHVLKRLAEKEDFNQYTQYIKNQTDLIKNSIMESAAKLCLSVIQTEIKTIAHYTISQLLRKIQGSFEKNLTEHTSHFDEFHIAFFDRLSECNVQCNEESIEELKRSSSGEMVGISHFRRCVLNHLESLEQRVLSELHLPSETDDLNIYCRWLQSFPLKLDDVILRQLGGCCVKCPFCGSVCDSSTTGHEHHETQLHYPTGINGMHNRASKKLSVNICTLLVKTRKVLMFGCTHGGVGMGPTCECEQLPFRKYDEKYPQWRIRPTSDNEPIDYWKLVMRRFNREFASFYTSKKGINIVQADLPRTWRKIEKEQAIDSLDTIYAC